MTKLTVRRIDGDSAILDGSAVESLKNDLRGQLCCRGDDGYDQVRTVWNAMINRRPALADAPWFTTSGERSNSRARTAC